MGISVALTPSTTVVTVSKSMITNASFRTKKLPGELAFFLHFRDPELRLFYPSASIIVMFRKNKFQFLSVQTNMLMLPSHLSSPFFECKVT
jgi:Hyccin